MTVPSYYTSEEIWGYIDEGGYWRGGVGVSMENSLKVLNDILADKGSDKKYKIMDANDWDWDDWLGVGSGKNNVKDLIEKGPIFLQGIYHEQAHAVALLREEDGTYIMADSKKKRPVLNNEKTLKQYLKRSVSGNAGTGLSTWGTNSYKMPVLVPAW